MKQYALAVLVASALIGCKSTGKGQGEYDIATKLATAGNYSEAIAYLQQAIAKEPKNKQYSAQLDSLRQQAAQSAFNKAKQYLASVPLNIAAIESAEAALKDISSFQPSFPGVSTLSTSIETSRQQLLNDTRIAYEQGMAAIDQKDWVAANTALQKVQAMYPNYESTIPQLGRIKTEGARDYLLQAKQAYDALDFESTLRFAGMVRKLDANNPMAAKLASEAAQSNNPVYFKQIAAEAFEQQNWTRLLFACERVAKWNAQDTECQGWRALAAERQANDLVDDGMRLLGEGYLVRAIEKAIEVKQLLNGASTNAVNALVNTLIIRVMRTADEYAEQGAYGIAWYLYERLAKLDPRIDGLFVASRDVQDKLNKRVTKSIAVFDFKSPSYSSDSGVLIANKLIANLFNNAGKDTNILERENLKSILEEMKLGQIGVVSEDTAKEMGRLYGIDIAIMGSVLLFKVDESKTQSAETVRYQVGEEIKDNIDFLNWQALNPNPSKRDLADAPVPKIMQPVYAERQYTVTTAKKVGFIEISFRIVDVATGENTRVETIESRLVVEDTGNEGVQDANVQFDPLEIMTDTEMLQQMADKVVQELSLKVLQPLRNRELKYYAKGEELLQKRQEPLAAMEEFVNTLFDERIKSNVNSPVSVQAEKYMEQIMLGHRFAG